MTQRIFKKSNKQDMTDLFNILPDEIESVVFSPEFQRPYVFEYEMESRNYYKTNDGYIWLDPRNHEFDEHEKNVLNHINIDFETDKVEEMIIKRPMEEDNDK